MIGCICAVFSIAGGSLNTEQDGSVIMRVLESLELSFALV